MKYKLVGYKYNNKGIQMSKSEQVFLDVFELTKKVPDLLDTFSNYEIYKNGKLIASNFKRRK